MQDQKATTTGTTTAATAGKKVVSSKKTSRDHRGSRVVDEKHARPGLTFERFFTHDGVDPFATVEWELRDAVISGADGKIYFEQRGVEFPKTWSQTATNVVVQKYFRGTLGTPERENSVRHMIARVADTIYAWGQGGRLLRLREGRVGVPRRAGAPAAAPEDGLQLAGLVQRRRRGATPVLGLLHQRRRRLDGRDPRAGQDRGHALQVRLGHRLEPVQPALVA
jgi:hypothetical protein